MLANRFEDAEDVDRRAMPGAKLAVDCECMLGDRSKSMRGPSSGLAKGFSSLRVFEMELLFGAGAVGVMRSGSVA